MYVRRKGNVWASEVADYLNLELVGPDFLISGPSSIVKPKGNSLVCLEDLAELENQGIGECQDVLFLTLRPLPATVKCSYIISKDPKLDFVVILTEFFLREIEHHIHETAIIDQGVTIGNNVFIGDHVKIGPEVSIGDNCIIMNNVIINESVNIGKNVIIKDNAVIGSTGYSFVYDINKKPIHIPQLGPINIGDNVWIGSNSTIEKAEIKETIINHDVKIDDLVHIGGGCQIGPRSMVTAGAVLGRNVTIGVECWLAPNVSIRDEVSIEDNVMVGIGSVVVRSLPKDGIYVGCPAKFLKKNEKNSHE